MKYLFISTILVLALLSTVYCEETPIYTNVNLSSNCGPNCLTVFLKINGIDTNIREVANLAEKGSKGTSLVGLKKAAVAKGIHAVGIKVSSLRNLRNIGYQAIALVKRKNRKTYDHFVLLIGYRDDKVKIVDPPKMPYTMPMREFEKLLEGRVLLLSRNPIVLPKKPKNTKFLILMIALIGVILFYLLKNRKLRESIRDQVQNHHL